MQAAAHGAHDAPVPSAKRARAHGGQDDQGPLQHESADAAAPAGGGGTPAPLSAAAAGGPADDTASVAELKQALRQSQSARSRLMQALKHSEEKRVEAYTQLREATVARAAAEARAAELRELLLDSMREAGDARVREAVQGALAKAEAERSQALAAQAQQLCEQQQQQQGGGG